MTRDDLLKGNIDLLTFCARLIESEPATSMAIRWNAPLLDLEVSRLDRIDVYVDGRPHQTHDVVDQLAGRCWSIRRRSFVSRGIKGRT